MISKFKRFDKCFQVLASSGSLLMLLYSDTNYALEVPLLKLAIVTTINSRIGFIFIILSWGSLRATQPTCVNYPHHHYHYHYCHYCY